ncbi:uncharacterized protein E0L32_005053 [Thyridium curvatum]|uniref:EKC/KEOPS complex subunit BUD32 n=1 Tax=Thyridium curvatum TaxID=1093900 RepID=A0A507B8K4_9PEZI|nr:uncharacterized protein E0L32_005053 [Thyridium curvatum]TPX14944.1 hypothetical protein E0L32_005053 [Thyridium curvatum]
MWSSRPVRHIAAPSEMPPLRDWWEYPDAALFSLQLSRREKAVLRSLERLPHPNVVQAIAYEDEGIYLRRCLPLNRAEGYPRQGVRVQWYRDVLRGLGHLHHQGICHSDLRPDNILFSDHRDAQAVLCDFSKASRFGEPNDTPHSATPVPPTGMAKTASDATDRFAMAYLIFEMETGAKPGLTTSSEGQLSVPHLSLGNHILEAMVRKAWSGHYRTTSNMLADAEGMIDHEDDGTIEARNPAPPQDTLREQVRQWRQGRLSKHGLVLNGLITDGDELDRLAGLCRWEGKWW